MAKFPADARVQDFKSPECRVSYAQSLFKARAVNAGSPEKYGCTLIFPKKDLAVFKAHVLTVARKAWPSNGEDRLKKGLIKSPLLMGDGKEARNKESGELLSGMGPDVFFIRPIANLDRPPVIRVRGKGEHVPATQAEVYSGCYGFAVLGVFPWNHPQSGDGISFGISYFQKMRDGDSLGGAAPVDAGKWYVPDAEEGEEGEDDNENPFA